MNIDHEASVFRIVKEIPFEYAVELNRLINLSMEGSVG